MRPRDILFLSLCTLAIAATASAQTTYTAVLSGASEVPANGSTATGSITVVLNAAQTELSITCQFQNLVRSSFSPDAQWPSTASPRTPRVGSAMID